MTASEPGVGPRSSLSEAAGRRPRIADFDRIHRRHDNAEFHFPEANAQKDLSVRPSSRFCR
jgi:hypothetical protein